MPVRLNIQIKCVSLEVPFQMQTLTYAMIFETVITDFFCKTMVLTVLICDNSQPEIRHCYGQLRNNRIYHGPESKTSIFDFNIFQMRQKTE